jgi:N-acetylglutamate synthase-like GNAT family acetyltransferase
MEDQRIWVVERRNKVVGSIAIVKHTVEEAQLRWLLLDSESRGFGLGRKLVQLALDFCNEIGYRKVFLWTVSILEVAAHLYTSYGFQRTELKTHTIWGQELTEEKYELVLN